MVTTHNLGFPRIGVQRELKFALEKYWQGALSVEQLEQCGSQLRARHWQLQSGLSMVPVGDFSLYDQVLDMSFMLGNVPDRVKKPGGNLLDNYFRVARGRSSGDTDCECVHAGEMTKWFDTNYHYIVPELSANTQFSLDTSRLLKQIAEARLLQHQTKPVIIGPLTYLWLGKTSDDSDRLDLLPRLIPVYAALISELADSGVDWIQIDEPILVTELDAQWKQGFIDAYKALASSKPHNKPHNRPKLLLASYFGALQDNLELVCGLAVDGMHFDVATDQTELHNIVSQVPGDKIISLGVINGRNIWKSDLHQILAWLEPIHGMLQDRLWIAPSCSLLHVPIDLQTETRLDSRMHYWLAFARQKLDELGLLANALNHGRVSVQQALVENSAAIELRRHSTLVHNPEVKLAVKNIGTPLGRRINAYSIRANKQSPLLNLPRFPTTTIGSFPQTREIRQARNCFRSGKIDEAAYKKLMQGEISRCVNEQDRLGLDVLVHGEPERNDMVEYFGELLQGFAITEGGWVQSYGSRCVKPPILFGDVSRPKPMTLEWITYAQSLTTKPMKGMLTGPVTLLNWSFVRDDQPRFVSCYQIALAIRQEVLDLESAGVRVIQIDEAALREGLPLRRSEWGRYLQWAVEAFRIAANGVKDETQIHTHMCYSEFNDIIAAIAAMDADVITIETSRSNMELLDAFDHFNYPNEIGPGVYDIHTPNTPDQKQIIQLMNKASERIPSDRLWINPDCGLKTRTWEEVIPALKNMVSAARELRVAHLASVPVREPQSEST